MDTTPSTYDFLSGAPPDTIGLEQEASAPSHVPTLSVGQPAGRNTTQANLGTQAAPSILYYYGSAWNSHSALRGKLGPEFW